jgi:cysteinyl-tRNA synthetase
MVVLKELSQILGLFRERPKKASGGDDGHTAALIGLLIELRGEARKEKNFKLADEIRRKLTAIGIALEDRPDGTIWRIESS